VTTQKAKDHDGVAHLRSVNRNVREAADRLTTAAKSSKNAQNQDAYQLFLELQPHERETFLNDVFIIDCTEDIGALEGRLHSTVRLIFGPKFADVALNGLLGWWTRLLVGHLLRKGIEPITASILEAELERMRERLVHGVLRIDNDIWGLTAPESLDDEARLLIEQLRLVEMSDDGVRYALHDYFQAYTQCGRWREDGVVHKHELTDYENRLRYEWGRHIAIHASPSTCEKKTEAELIHIGKNTHDTLTSRSIQIRKGVDEPLITRGYYYGLSNERLIGWHPNFVSRLAHILNTKSA
jgi:hypothetical protein